MPSLENHRAARGRVQPGRRSPPDPAVPALLLLCGLGIVLLLIAAVTFRVELASLLEWGSSPEPWWRP